MQYQVADIGPCSKELSIVVQPDLVKSEFKKTYSELRKHANINGFRKGKVPLSVIKSRYASKVKSEVLEVLIPKAIENVVGETKLQILTRPKISDVDMDEDSGKLDFKAQLVLFPEFDAVDCTKLKLEAKPEAVGDEQIDASLGRLQESMATYVDEVERPLAEGDEVVLNIAASLDGTDLPEFTRENFAFVVDPARGLPGFAEQIVGLEKEAQKEFPLTIPAESSNKELAGKEVMYNVTVKTIKEKTLPTMDDAFAAEIPGSSFTTMDEVKAEIRAQLESEQERHVAQTHINEIQQQLVDANSFPVPDIMVDSEVDNLKRQQKNPEDQAASPEELEAMRSTAEGNVRARFVVHKLAQEKGLECTDKELESKIVAISSSMRMSFDKTKAWLDKNGYLSRLEEEVVEEKAYMLIIEDTKTLGGCLTQE